MWTAGEIGHLTQGQVRVRGVGTPVSTLAQPVGLMTSLVPSDWTILTLDWRAKPMEFYSVFLSKKINS